MTRGLGNTKNKNKKEGLTKDKDYITETYLQGGKAVGEMLSKKDNKSKKK